MPCFAPPAWNREIAEFTQLIEGVSRDLGEPLHCTSWWRTASENERVGGAAASQHLVGLAVDVLPPADRARLLELASAWGLTPIDEGDHVHIQRYRAGSAPRDALGFAPSGPPPLIDSGQPLPGCGVCCSAA